MPGPLVIIALVSVFLAVVFLLAAFTALRRRRVLRMTVDLTFVLLLLSFAALFGGVAIATRGYQMLTYEQVVATVETEPTGPRRFNAKLQLADGTRKVFALAGDELYVDAHILKWKPLANFFGLHTAFELDRIAGRYRDLKEEQTGVRTVHSLAEEKPVDMFTLRQRYTALAPLLDAEYGSATFIGADRARVYEIRLSTTGLLVREVARP